MADSTFSTSNLAMGATSSPVAEVGTMKTRADLIGAPGSTKLKCAAVPESGEICGCVLVVRGVAGILGDISLFSDLSSKLKEFLPGFDDSIHWEFPLELRVGVYVEFQLTRISFQWPKISCRCPLSLRE